VSNDVPVVILGGKIALDDDAEGVKYGLSEYFAAYW